MIIYIPLEISVRELSGHLLLATVAASRGHQVFIAPPSDLWLYKRLNLLPKGSYLLKNMNVTTDSQQVYEIFIEDGFDLYCLEQEPSILWGDFKKFLNSRSISKNQMFPFKGVFCWGERDSKGYKSFFESREELFFDTGSPRADLWHDRFAPIRWRDSFEQLKPYILLVSNFGLLMGERHWSEWMSRHRENEILKTNHQEDNFIKFLKEDSSAVYKMIEAVNYLSAKYPNFNIVVRPHPLDCIHYWEKVFSNRNRVHVSDNISPLSSWISGASAVIQNGCTSALEAVLQKIPVISYGPDRTHGDLVVPNLLGVRACNTKELDDALKNILNGNYNKINQVKSEEVLKPLISTEHCSASLQIVEIMESRSMFSSDDSINHTNLMRMRLIRTTKNYLDLVRRRLKPESLGDEGHKLDREAIREQIDLMSEILEINPPKQAFVSNTGLLVG